MVRATPQALPSRRLTEKTCRRYGYGVDEDNRQVATYYDDHRNPVAQKVRTVNKAFTILGDPKAMRLYGQHLSKGGGKILTICEGELDALSMDQAHKNQYSTVSVPNGAQSAASAVIKELEWVESFKTVRICMDMDEPGKKAALEIAAVLTPGKAEIITLPLKDPSEMLQAGRTAELVSCFWNAKPFRPDGVLRWEDLFEEVKSQKAPPMVPWNHTVLQHRTGGIQEGSLVVVAAGPASGKSTFVHELVHHLASHGHRTGVISLEQSERETVLGLLTPLTDTPLHRVESLDLNDYQEQADKLNGMVSVYRHVGRMDAETLEDTAKWMAKADGCSHIVLDNLSVVVSSESGAGANDRQVIDDLLNRLVSLTKEVGVTVLLVVHLKRPGQGEGYSEGRVPRLEDMRGSGMIEAMSYTVVGLSRDQAREDGAAELHLLKCRHTGEAGSAGGLKYDRETGRLQEAMDFEATTESKATNTDF
jgi:twinkle protein